MSDSQSHAPDTGGMGAPSAGTDFEQDTHAAPEDPDAALSADQDAPAVPDAGPGRTGPGALPESERGTTR